MSPSAQMAWPDSMCATGLRTVGGNAPRSQGWASLSTSSMFFIVSQSQGAYLRTISRTRSIISSPVVASRYVSSGLSVLASRTMFQHCPSVL